MYIPIGRPGVVVMAAAWPKEECQCAGSILIVLNHAQRHPSLFLSISRPPGTYTVYMRPLAPCTPVSYWLFGRHCSTQWQEKHAPLCAV